MPPGGSTYEFSQAAHANPIGTSGHNNLFGELGIAL